MAWRLLAALLQWGSKYYMPPQISRAEMEDTSKINLEVILVVDPIISLTLSTPWYLPPVAEPKAIQLPAPDSLLRSNNVPHISKATNGQSVNKLAACLGLLCSLLLISPGSATSTCSKFVAANMSQRPGPWSAGLDLHLAYQART